VIRRALVLLALLAPLAVRAQNLEVGQPAPDFGLATLQGGEVHLSQLRDHPVLINFWASWCAPCRTEMPEIVAAYSAHRGAGLEVLAVNLTDQESRSDVRRFVAEMRMAFPVLLDERGRVRRAYQLRGVPTTVFVDTAGIVRAIHPGPLTSEALARGLGSILPAR
jgi:cytochrome c biogenesis protein CcmG/thiol:disulfide interchange protein DsbE